jgi:hypothetical protein
VRRLHRLELTVAVQTQSNIPTFSILTAFSSHDFLKEQNMWTLTLALSLWAGALTGFVSW